MSDLLTLMKKEILKKEEDRKDLPEFHIPIKYHLTYLGGEIDWDGPRGMKLLKELSQIPITKNEE